MIDKADLLCTNDCRDVTFPAVAVSCAPPRTFTLENSGDRLVEAYLMVSFPTQALGNPKIIWVIVPGEEWDGLGVSVERNLRHPLSNLDPRFIVGLPEEIARVMDPHMGQPPH